MKQRFLAAVGAVGLSVSLLAGCTSVNGVDLEKVMNNAMNVTSYEGSHQLSFRLETAAVSDGRPDYSVLDGGKLVITEVKQEDKTKSSMKGELQYGSQTVPFQSYQSGGETALVLEGSKVPLIMGGAPGGEKKEPEGAAFGFNLANLNWQELLVDYGPSLLKYMPVPEGLTVTEEKVTVNGQALDTKRIHTELTGEQLGGILQEGIMGLLADTEGSDQLIGEIVGDVLGENGSDLAKNLGVIFVKQYLREMADDLSKMGAFAEYLNKSNTLKLDLYVDKDQQVRRYAYDLKLGGLKLYDGALTGLQMTGVSDRWNIGGAVKADTADTSEALSASKPGGMARYIKGLDKSSAAYQLLVKDLKVTRKHLVLPSVKGVEPGAADTPYIDNEVTLVPVRFVTENLDAEVEWIESDPPQVKVTDIISGKTLLFTIGSKTVQINGVEREMPGRAVLTGNYTFVPVRIIAEEFGAKVNWNEDTWVVSIVRN